MKSLKILIILLVLVVGGCPSAGRDPNPIATHFPGDEERSCEALKLEFDQIETEMKLLKPKINKFGTNLFWFLLWAPLMDVKDAEKIEYDAFQRRYNHLLIIARDKDCQAELSETAQR